MYILLLLAFWIPETPQDDAKNDILIITSQATTIDQISILQLRQLYLKKTDTLNQVKITPVQLKTTHPLRIAFDHMVMGERFNSENYWIEQNFRGGEKPPVSVTNEAFVLIFVERNEGFIGYVHKGLSGEVKRLGLKIIEVKL